MDASQELPSAYDKHTIFDTFYRYWQNSDLLSLLARYLGNVKDEVHLDIGFSGRLGLFSCLASRAYILNPSITQLAIGESLLPQMVSFCHLARPHLEKKKFPPRVALEAFPWLSECSATVRRKIVRDLVMQVRVIVSESKSPRECQLITRAEYFGPHKPDVENDLFHSITMIDILPHVEDIKPIFAEIYRVLRPGGYVIASYFPFAQKEFRSRRFRCVDEIFSMLAREYGIKADNVCNLNNHEVYPSMLGDMLQARYPEEYKKIYAKYWLDLPCFRLHSPVQIEEVVRNVGLRMVEHVDVPGGMYKAARRAMVLTKD